jgi:flagellar biosynthesis protein FliQ
VYAPKARSLTAAMVHREVKLTVTLKFPATVAACVAGIKVSIEASPANINFVFVIKVLQSFAGDTFPKSRYWYVCNN